MFKRNKLLMSPVCLLLALALVCDFTIFNPAPARALDKKSVLVGAGIGAAAGAGIVLAAPAVASAIGAAGGIAGIGTAIVGGLAAAGGAIVGVLGAIGGAIAAGVGAVAGWIAGIVCSPLFIPALIIVAAVAIGYYLYRKHKKNNPKPGQPGKPGDYTVMPEDGIVITPGEYDMNPVLPPNSDGPITIGDDDGITLPGSQVAVSGAAPVGTTPAVGAPAATTPTTGAGAIDLQAAEARFQRAYEAYTKYVTSGVGDRDGVMREYKEAMELRNRARQSMTK